MSNENQTVTASGTAQPRNDMQTFLQAWVESKNVAEVAKKLGIAEGSVNARASAYRKRGIALPKFARQGGGGVSINVAEANALLASLTNRSVDEVKAEGQKLADAAKERAAAAAAQVETQAQG